MKQPSGNDLASLPLVLFLNNIRSLHNVGAILRSSEAVGIKNIILQGITPKPPRFEIDKTSLGALNGLAWEYTQDATQHLALLKKEGYHLYALELTQSSSNIFQTRLEFPAVLIVGNEREGVENDILNMCKGTLEIPMYGEHVHSLNVSNATAVALYEFRRQFQNNGQKISA